MAQKTRVLLIDDLDGGEAHESVTFGVDGVEYDIDLSEANAKRLRDALGVFVPYARRVGRTRSAGQSAGAVAKRATAKRPDEFARTREMNNAIRSWAKGEGLPVSDRGRISAGVLDKYMAAHPGL
jgi:hypothetical protein